MLEIAVGKGEENEPFMSYSWNCWNSIRYFALATWHGHNITWQYDNVTLTIDGYNYEYFLFQGCN